MVMYVELGRMVVVETSVEDIDVVGKSDEVELAGDGVAGASVELVIALEDKLEVVLVLVLVLVLVSACSVTVSV
jgi:hypothetical protein